MPLPTNNWLELALALQAKLQAELPALVAEVNAEHSPGVVITMPPSAEVEYGISLEMLELKIAELPVVAVGVYERRPVQDLEQSIGGVLSSGSAEIDYPFVIEAYLGYASRPTINKQAIKWAVLFDAFIRRHGSSIYGGYQVSEMSTSDTTLVLKKRDGYRQLVSVTGRFRTAE